MTTDAPATATSKPKSRWIFFAMAVIALIAIVGYFINDSIQQSRLALLREAVELKNSSLGHLENFKLQEAEDGLRRVRQLVPDQPLGLRDLAVTYLVRLQVMDRVQQAELFNQTVQSMKQTLSELKESSIDDADVFAMQALFHASLDEQDAAIASFLQAAELDKIDPAFPYQAFERMQYSPEEYSGAERMAAIESAYERAPENLVIVLAYLKMLAEVESEKLGDTLETSRPLFQPLSSRVSDAFSQNYDLAVSAAKAGDWKTSQLRLGFVGNLMKVEIAFLNDIHRLDPHPLEYLVVDFSPDFYDQYPSLKASNPSPVTVKFSTRDLSLPPKATAVGVADLSFDGNEDLIVARDKTLTVFPLSGSNQEPIYSIELDLPVAGIVAADLDRDYRYTRNQAMAKGFEGMLDTDLDLIVWGEEGLRLLQNEWDLDEKQLQLRSMPLPEGAEKLTDIRDVAIADLDHDGDLDFAVVSQQGVSFWSNNGNWTFEDLTPFSHLPEETASPQRLLAADVDRNILNDFLVATDSGLFLLENNLHGRYLSRPLKSVEGPVTDVAILDINRDASWDLLTAGPSGLHLIVGETLRQGGWKPQRTNLVSETAALGVEVWDYNNDGFDDAVAWSEAGIEIFAGGPGNTLALQSDVSAALPGCSELRVTDSDRDGDQDLVVLTDGKLKLIENEGGNANHSIDIRLRAEEVVQRTRERCNMHGVGNLLELKSGGVYQSRIVRGPVTHFGIGQRSDADVMRIVWTNGIPHNVLNPKQDDVILEQQHLKGSCPYLYTWDGEQFVFATDCLWAAPIGLQFAQGILAPIREWEYLKLSGNLLKPKDDEYVLQMTEELWEAAYYDSVKLMAVDHPAEVDVFTNEKVGPAEIAEFQVHTVTDPRDPVSVIDQQGRDISDQTRSADGIYTKTWDQSFTQGLTETHWLEIDLGEFENPSQIKLFLTGWVFPTDTSLNIAISQNPDMPRPKPPALHVPDANGEWQEVSPFVGFPGGKTKTIVLDLSDRFLTDDYRVRIVTNMEIRWDHVCFTVDDPDAEYELTDLTLTSADLHYRGFSARIPRSNNHHEDYDYSQVSQQPLWPPMGGNFTRFGEVTDLIREADDLQVVMGSGDEMTVHFAVPEKPIPDGWVRDFILYNIGWDKDADLNTVLGQQAEPLPFRAMQAYPYEPEQSFPDTPAHRAFLKTYQTRHQPQPIFRTQIRDWEPSQKE